MVEDTNPLRGRVRAAWLRWKNECCGWIERGEKQAEHRGFHQKEPHDDYPRTSCYCQPATPASYRRDGYRDRALLSLGMMGALRRSELVAIDVAHVEAAPRGLIIRIPTSKADQERRGQS